MEEIRVFLGSKMKMGLFVSLMGAISVDFGKVLIWSWLGKFSCFWVWYPWKIFRRELGPWFEMWFQAWYPQNIFRRDLGLSLSSFVHFFLFPFFHISHNFPFPLIYLFHAVLLPSAFSIIHQTKTSCFFFLVNNRKKKERTITATASVDFVVDFRITIFYYIV